MNKRFFDAHKRILKTTSIFCLGAFAIITNPAHATSQLGLGVGGIGAMGDELRDASAGIGFTGFIRTQPMTFGMVEVAGLYSKMDFVHYWAINPSMIFLLASYSDFQFGLAGGVGFYHSSVPGATRFGLSGGAHFDMSIDTNLSMGFQMKAHKVLSDEVLDQWSLMVTLAYKWRGGGW